MHLLDGTTVDGPEKKKTMPGTSGDSRLRRKTPVSMRPLKLRLGARSGGDAQRQFSSNPHQKLSTEPPKVYQSSRECSGYSPSAFTAVASTGMKSQDLSENDRLHSEDKKHHVSCGTSNGRPLIHHQRHNLKTRFHLLRTLGEGTYGKVKLAADRSTGEHVAIKYIKKTKIQEEGDLQRIRREIQILSSLRHRHIVNIREVFEKKDKIVLVMDYAQGGELYDYLNKMGRLDEWEARRIFRQMVSAIHYCHQNGIVHRDLKLENIILDDEGNVKIADFGLANYYSHNNTLKTYCGSPLYASPEIVNGKPYHGPEVDVWSLGVILYTLVYGAMPFESNSLVSLRQQISEGDYRQPAKPSDAAGLIRHMLTVTASRRASMTDALRHWWINFGHSQMPNDQPYCPEEDEAPSLGYTDEPITVIHTRNQSSISSDSDVELDFKPCKWSSSTRSRRLDSTGNSLSSSVAGSPAPTIDSGIGMVPEDAASIASGLLKLPPDVLEILKGCSSKSLAALLHTDKISTGFDMDYSVPEPQSVNVLPMCQTENKPVSHENDTLVSPSVFDSERKPKRGILKRKGKFSGGDSGCMVHEEMTSGRSEDRHIPKSGHLPRRLPSFRDEAHGIFASKHRASQLLEGGSHLGCTSVLSQGDWYTGHANSIHEQSQSTSASSDFNQSMQIQPAQQHFKAAEPGTSNACLASTSTFNDSLNGNINVPQSSDWASVAASQTAFCVDNRSPNSGQELDQTFKEPAKVVRRPKGILKSSKLTQMEEARNRLSISSIGSNSSADILDLSYESGDSDHYVNLAGSESPDHLNCARPSLSSREVPSHGMMEMPDQTEAGLTQDFEKLDIGQDLCEEGREIWTSKSSLLYRLTRDAQGLL